MCRINKPWDSTMVINMTFWILLEYWIDRKDITFWRRKKTWHPKEHRNIAEYWGRGRVIEKKIRPCTTFISERNPSMYEKKYITERIPFSRDLCGSLPQAMHSAPRQKGYILSRLQVYFKMIKSISWKIVSFTHTVCDAVHEASLQWCWFHGGNRCFSMAPRVIFYSRFQ